MLTTLTNFIDTVVNTIFSYVSIQQIIFFSFSTVAIFSAIAVIFARNSVRAVLFLVLTFFATAGLWMTLQAEFLSIILVLVYVGAVMVLFLFVVMMLDVEKATIRSRFTRYFPLGLLMALLFVIGLIYALSPQFGPEYKTQLPEYSANYSNIKVLGELMYTQYLYPLEIAGILLLVAMIAAISLTLRQRADTRTPNPSWQINIDKKDRIKMIKMTKETEVYSHKVENNA